jgi:DNA-binding beta-propeller fold protein YncE
MIDIAPQICLCLCFLALGAEHAIAAEPDFRPQLGFVKLPAGMTLGACSAVAVNRKGEVILFHRGKRPLLVLDADGNILRSWGDDLIVSAHGLRVDPGDNVWVTDWQGHRVFKFSPEGKVLLVLGTGKPGDATDQFNKPTDIGFGPANEIFLTDGYGNSRVMKFTSEGRFVEAWGKRGTGEGEFNLPHSVIVDARGRVLVGDRENDRVQIFDTNGKLLEIWKGFAPYGLAFDKEGRLFVADARAHKVLAVDDHGLVTRSWGGRGIKPGQFDTPHMLAFDLNGNLYVAEVGGKRLQRLVRK